MKLLELTDLLKIEDILPFFPDFVVIDDFKEEICSALERYSAQVQSLKQDMAEAQQSADTIKQDISDLSTRLIVLDGAEKCSSCGLLLLSRQFYVFPCQHAFHADCLIREATQVLPSHALRRVIELQNKLFATNTRRPVERTLTTPANGTRAPIPRNKLATASLQSIEQLRKLVIPDALITVIGAGAEGLMDGVGGAVKLMTRDVGLQGALEKADNSSLDALKAELDGLLAASCVLCEKSLSSLDQPFLLDGEEDI